MPSINFVLLVVRSQPTANTWLASLGDGLGAGASEDDDVEERVCSESVCAVDRGAGGLAGSEESGHDDVLAVLVGDDLMRKDGSSCWVGLCKARILARCRVHNCNPQS